MVVFNSDLIDVMDLSFIFKLHIAGAEINGGIKLFHSLLLTRFK